MGISFGYFVVRNVQTLLLVESLRLIVIRLVIIPSKLFILNIQLRRLNSTARSLHQHLDATLCLLQLCLARVRQQHTLLKQPNRIVQR